MTAVIRSASSNDRDGIIRVVKGAFSDQTRDGSEEVHIVAETWCRQASPEGLELVADDDGSIVGHVLAALGDLAGVATIGIAPLSVSPEHQRQGNGSALMRELLLRVEAARWPIALLLGDPRYYSQFGFQPAADFGITYRPVGAGNSHFMARAFAPPTAGSNADFTYCWEQHES